MAIIAPQDLLFLLMEGREKPAHVGGLQLFEPPPGADDHFIRELFEGAVSSSAPVRALFQRRVARTAGVGLPVWEHDDRFDLEYHLRHSALPGPGRIRELLALVSRMHGTMLDRGRPLWEATLIEGLSDGRFALYTKVHHALVDGVGAMRLLIESLSSDPDERAMPMPWERRPDDPAGALTGMPGSDRAARGAASPDDTWAALISDGLRKLGAGLAGLRGAADELGVLVERLTDQLGAMPSAPRSPLNVPISGARRFAAQSWPLERIKAAGRPHTATVNDMVLAMSAGALRNYLLDHGALPDDPLVAMVPVALKTRGAGDGTGNAVGAILCSLGTHLDDAGARLEHIQRSMAANKSRLEGLTPAQILALSALSLAPAALSMSPLGRIGGDHPLLPPRFNVVISNVPGSPEPLHWNGARLTGAYPVSVLTEGQALNITTTSYAGSLDFGVIGCRRAMPSLQRILVHLDDELSALEAC